MERLPLTPYSPRMKLMVGAGMLALSWGAVGLVVEAAMAVAR